LIASRHCTQDNQLPPPHTVVVVADVAVSVELGRVVAVAARAAALVRAGPSSLLALALTPMPHNNAMTKCKQAPSRPGAVAVRPKRGDRGPQLHDHNRSDAACATCLLPMWGELMAASPQRTAWGVLHGVMHHTHCPSPGQGKFPKFSTLWWRYGCSKSKWLLLTHFFFVGSVRHHSHID
jgi:hypothetical protein